MAANVFINQNITGLVGNADTDLTCSFFLESDEMINSVQIIAKNITEEVDVENPIAIFRPNIMTKLHPLGEYLFGRVTLTNITDKSTNASLTFHMLERIDENSYMCKCYYNDINGEIKYAKSDATRILVKSEDFSLYFRIRSQYSSNLSLSYFIGSWYQILENSVLHCRFLGLKAEHSELVLNA